MACAAAGAAYIGSVARGYRHNTRRGYANRDRGRARTIHGSDGQIDVGAGGHIAFTMSTCTLHGTGRMLTPSSSDGPDAPHLVRLTDATLIDQVGVSQLRDATVSLSARALTVLTSAAVGDAADTDGVYRAHAKALDRAQLRVMQEVLWQRDEHGAPTALAVALDLLVADGTPEANTERALAQVIDSGLVCDIAGTLHLTPHGTQVLERT